METIMVGAGCFWGVQTTFDSLEGVVSTEVGYAGGAVPNPTYEQVCQGQTNHAEVVRVVFDSQQISLQSILEVFWQCHDPSSVDRQGPDVGSQYRSCLFYASDSQLAIIQASKQALLNSGKVGFIATQIEPAPPFYRAEEYHQHYHQKHPR